MICQITFQFKPLFPMTPHRSLSIVGNIFELGLWSDFNQHSLEKDPKSPEYYLSKHSLSLPLYSAFQYKMVVVEANHVIHWENLPFNTNRSYNIHEFFITLQGLEGDLLIREISFLSFIQDSLIEDKNALKKKYLDESLNSQFDISLEGYENALHEKTFKSTSSNNLSKIEKFISRKNQRGKEKTSESITIHNFRKNLKKDSHTVSETSMASLAISHHNSRKDINSLTGPFLKEYEEEKTLKRMDLQQIYRKMMDKTPNKLRGFSLLKSQNDIVYQITEDYIINLNYDEIVYVMMGYLPLSASWDRKEMKWNISFTPPLIEILKYTSHFFSQAKNQYKKMMWVGMLYEQVPTEMQSGLKQLLYENYRCLVAFPKTSIHLNYILYCYEYLDPVLSNSFNKDNCSIEMVERFNSGYEDFRMINEMLAELVIEHSKENPLIFVIDYHLILINFYLAKKIVKPAIVFYYGMTFPCLENFQLLQFSEELLNSMLLGNIICFNEFAHARQFLAIIAVVMGLKYEARRGDIMVRFMGRQIKIKISSIGIDTTYLEILKRSNEFIEMSKEISNRHQGKNIIFSVDSFNKLALLDVKLRLYAKLLADEPSLKNQTIFVQIVNPNYWDIEILLSGFNQNSLNNYLESLKNLIEELSPWVLVVINLDPEFIKNKNLLLIFKNFFIKSINSLEIYGYMNAAKLFLKSSIKNDNCIEVLEFLYLNENNGQALFSDFITLNPLYTKINKYNPFSFEEFKLKTLAIMNPLDKTFEEIVFPNLESNASLLKKHTIITWLEALLYDLKKSILFAKHANLTKVEKLTSYHSITYFKMATNEFFKYLNFKEIIKNYGNSYNRIIILDYEGTLVRSNQFADPLEILDLEGNPLVILKPSDNILEGLKLICNDPRNSVYLITGKSPKELGPWVLDVRNLNIFCEYGYLIRLKKACNQWIRLYECEDWRWKYRAKEIMEQYSKNTQGSSINEKESGVVWNFGEVPEDLGWKEADLLEKQLKSELSHNKEIEIIRGRYYVEIRFYGINKVKILKKDFFFFF